MLRAFLLRVSGIGPRKRVWLTRLLHRIGFTEEAFLLFLAVLIGIVTGVAAVGFHEHIKAIRNLLYGRAGPAFLHGRGLPLLVLIPAIGALAAGLLSKFVFRTREGHGIVDVIVSVIRSSGFQKPIVAIEEIITSAVAIGSGGSAGAEGPIVQLGAAIASGVVPPACRATGREGKQPEPCRVSIEKSDVHPHAKFVKNSISKLPLASSGTPRRMLPSATPKETANRTLALRKMKGQKVRQSARYRYGPPPRSISVGHRS